MVQFHCRTATGCGQGNRGNILFWIRAVHPKGLAQKMGKMRWQGRTVFWRTSVKHILRVSHIVSLWLFRTRRYAVNSPENRVKYLVNKPHVGIMKDRTESLLVLREFACRCALAVCWMTSGQGTRTRLFPCLLPLQGPAGSADCSSTWCASNLQDTWTSSLTYNTVRDSLGLGPVPPVQLFIFTTSKSPAERVKTTFRFSRHCEQRNWDGLFILADACCETSLVGREWWIVQQ